MSAVLKDSVEVASRVGEQTPVLRNVEWIRIFDSILEKLSLSGNYFISREALDTLSGSGPTTLFDVLDWFNACPDCITVGETRPVTSQLSAYFGFDASKPNATAFFVQIDLTREGSAQGPGDGTGN
jgi:hypothetical protein